VTRIGWRSIALALLLCSGAAVADEGAPIEKLNAEDSEGQLLLIEQALSAGRLIQTEAMLRWAEPRLVRGYGNRFNLLLAEYHLAQDNVVLAEQAISTVDGSLADSCRYTGIWGWISFQKQDWNRAITMLASALDKCPGDPGRWNLLGQALAHKGEYPASVEAFDAALTLQPTQASVLNNRALSFAYSGSVDQAIVDLTQAAALQPSNPTIAENLAFLSANAGIAMSPETPASASPDARSLAKAGEGALAAHRGDAAISYFAQAVLASERFDADLWRRANAHSNTEVP
jgi:Flp pilus assembly protein TadD